jgi:hypothetical protein
MTVIDYPDRVAVAKMLLDQQAEINTLRRRADVAEAEVALVRAVAVRLVRQLFEHADHAPSDHLEWVPADILDAAEDAEGRAADAGQDDVAAEGLTSVLGEFRHLRCPACQLDTLLASTMYTLAGDGMHVIGGIAACTECGWSPYTAMDLP